MLFSKDKNKFLFEDNEKKIPVASKQQHQLSRNTKNFNDFLNHEKGKQRILGKSPKESGERKNMTKLDIRFCVVRQTHILTTV